MADCGAMMPIRASFHVARLALPLGLVSLLVGCDQGTGTSDLVGSADGKPLPQTTAAAGDFHDKREHDPQFSGARHEEITKVAASSWVDSATIPTLEDASRIGDTDPNTWIRSEAHFDNCYWDEGRDWVLENRQDAVDAAVAFSMSGSASDKQAFFDQWGYTIHAIEDHYSHANWVETHDPGELAPNDVPNEPKPNGWISGTYNNSGDTGPDAGALHCPPGTPTHSILNKDGSGPGNNAEAYFTAVVAMQDQFDKMVDAVYVALPSQADTVLVDLGFVMPLPARNKSRQDETASLTFGSTTIGYMTPPLYCPDGMFVSGFAQRVEAPVSGDDTALNSVAFYCTASGQETRRLVAWEGVWGDWSAVENCPADAWISTAAFKSEPPQLAGDDTEGNAARFGCSDGTMLTANNDGAWGNWSADQSCGVDEAACGIALRVEPPLGGSIDDAAVSGMEVRCCSLTTDPGGTTDTGGSDTGDTGTSDGGGTGDTGDGGDGGDTGAGTTDTGGASGDGTAGSGDDGVADDGTGSGSGTSGAGASEGDEGCACDAGAGAAGPGFLAGFLLLGLAFVRRRS